MVMLLNALSVPARRSARVCSRVFAKKIFLIENRKFTGGIGDCSPGDDTEIN